MVLKSYFINSQSLCGNNCPVSPPSVHRKRDALQDTELKKTAQLPDTKCREQMEEELDRGWVANVLSLVSYIPSPPSSDNINPGLSVGTVVHWRRAKITIRPSLIRIPEPDSRLIATPALRRRSNKIASDDPESQANDGGSPSGKEKVATEEVNVKSVEELRVSSD